jgi:hypothetical protein
MSRLASWALKTERIEFILSHDGPPSRRRQFRRAKKDMGIPLSRAFVYPPLLSPRRHSGALSAASIAKTLGYRRGTSAAQKQSSN